MSSFSQVQFIENKFTKFKQIRESYSNGIYLAGEEYRNQNGKQWILPSVKLAEEEIREEGAIIADYTFPNMHLFSKLATILVLGEDSPAFKEDKVFSIQAMSGIAALRLGAEFLAGKMGKTMFYYSDPIWDKLYVVFKKAGFKESRPYRYWCPIEHDINFPGLLEDLQTAPEGTAIILHANAHNPTGIDISKDQWKQIAVVMKQRKLIPFFVSFHQGLSKGLEEDAWAIRYFVEQGLEFLCAQSFSEICGLYSEPIGNFFIVTRDTHIKNIVVDNVNSISRAIFLSISAPANRIITRLLSKTELKQKWVEDIAVMRNRITETRKQLRASLERLGAPGDWSFLTRQTGMISLLGINELQLEHLANKYHVHIKTNGAANITAISQSNIEYIAKAIYETLLSIP